MAGWKDMSGGSKRTVIACVVVLLGLGGYEVFKGREPADDAAKVGAQKTAPATDATASTAPASGSTAPAPAEPATPAPATTAPATTGTAAAPASEATAAAPATDTAAATAPAADAAPATDAAAASAPATTAPAAAEPAAPAASFDIVRVDPDGATVVAGQVAAGARVALLVDGAEIGSATADDSGKFVAIFNLPSAGAGRLMTMVATLPDGTRVQSGTSVALAATTAPAQVATAEAGATTAPAATTSEATTTEATTPTPAPAPAQTGTAALAVNDQGAKLLQPATPVPAELAANVTIDTIAYPSADTVQFGGHGKPGEFIQLYLDNVPLGEAIPVGADGTWNETQTGIAPKVHILRIDALDATGKVTSRYETPFKRETSEALAAATAPAAASGTAAATAPATGAAATPAPAAAPAKPAPVTVTVQPGYTLWGIAKQQFGEGVLYVQVYDANKDKIRNPDLIYPGQVFTIPQK